MLAEIEQKILEQLENKGLNVKAFEIKKEGLALVTPAVFCAIEGGEFSRVTMTSIKQTVSVYLTIIFDNFSNEKTRREGIYPILEGIIGILTYQKLDLEIDELMPTQFQNITDEQDIKNGQIWFQAIFKTGYIVGKMEDEIAENLLRVGLEYYLQDPADDGTKDAEDEITLT